MPYIGNPAVIGDSTNTFRSLDKISSFTLTFDAASTDIVSCLLYTSDAADE